MTKTMKDREKTKEQLVKKIKALQNRIKGFEKSKSRRKKADEELIEAAETKSQFTSMVKE